jgi:Zn-dependent peptidase ImmA (M78 family)
MVAISEALATIKRFQETLPVAVVGLANALGVKVYSAPNWNPNLSGMVRKNPASKGGFDIFVNADHPTVRRRFTIAHEIAHIVLHGHLIGDGITDDALLRSGLSNTVEAQANRLAADILMPRGKIQEFLDCGISDVKELASRFRVSPQAMSIRLGVPQ